MQPDPGSASRRRNITAAHRDADLRQRHVRRVAEKRTPGREAMQPADYTDLVEQKTQVDGSRERLAGPALRPAGPRTVEDFGADCPR